MGYHWTIAARKSRKLYRLLIDFLISGALKMGGQVPTFEFAVHRHGLPVRNPNAEDRISSPSGQLAVAMRRLGSAKLRHRAADVRRSRCRVSTKGGLIDQISGAPRLRARSKNYTGIPDLAVHIGPRSVDLTATRLPGFR